jgi:hypothetical protein
VEDKARFSTLAARSGLSESALALVAIRYVLGRSTKPASEAAGPALVRGPATDRITIRLRPGDGVSIEQRAAKRGMKPSAYIAALVRAHVTANPPWPAAELTALKQAVVVLAGVGRVLAQAARTSQGLSRDDLERVRSAVAVLEQRTHDFAKAALISWESRSA